MYDHFQWYNPHAKLPQFIRNIFSSVYPDESHVYIFQCKRPYFIKRRYVELFNICLNRYEKLNFSPRREKF